jgi:hypothetical protein
VSETIKDSIDSYIDAHHIDAAPEPRYTPVWTPKHEPTQLDLRDTGITSVIWSTGSAGTVGGSRFPCSTAVVPDTRPRCHQ